MNQRPHDFSLARTADYLHQVGVWEATAGRSNRMKSKRDPHKPSGRKEKPRSLKRLNTKRTANEQSASAEMRLTGASGGHATLRDVAVAVGVSPMTVSNFINSRPGAVGPETRARIQAEIERLGYRPHTVARNLRLSRRLSIDMVILDSAPLYLADPFTTQVVAGLSNSLNRKGYGLQLQGISSEAFFQSPLVRNIRSDGICLLLSGSDTTRRNVINTLLRLGQPIVVFQETFRFRQADICVIRQADRSGGGLVAREVLQRGAKRVVMLVPEIVWPAINERVAGAREVMLAAKPAPTFDIIDCGAADFHETQMALERYVAVHGYPDAILAGNDQMGIAAMKHMAAKGRNAPGDVSITGFNAFEFWQFTSPVLTTVHSPAYEMGARGGEEILARLTSGRFGRHEIVFPVELQRGGST
jgi:LacI family transcriptional regulator